MPEPLTAKSLIDTSVLCPPDDPHHPYSSWPAIIPNPIGRLALLTPEITAAAARSSLISGDRFALDYATVPSGASLFDRFPGHQDVFRVDGGPHSAEKAKADGVTYEPAFDSIVKFNTQGTTQWDYFLHYGYRHSGLFYGGLTADDICAQNTKEVGVAAIARSGGIQTRAILIDVPYFLEQQGLPPLEQLTYPSSTPIDLPFLERALAFFNLSAQIGDVLLVRTGFEELLVEDLERVRAGKDTVFADKWPGVKPTDQVVEWLWRCGFVAVGSDNPTFEEWYPKEPARLLHPILLSGWGMMIGELLCLTRIAQECKRRKRWHFFFSSCPLMIEHGIASPPNAVAIF